MPMATIKDYIYSQRNQHRSNKNFIKENMKQLKTIQKQFREQSEGGRINAVQKKYPTQTNRPLVRKTPKFLAKKIAVPYSDVSDEGTVSPNITPPTYVGTSDVGSDTRRPGSYSDKACQTGDVIDKKDACVEVVRLPKPLTEREPNSGQVAVHSQEWPNTEEYSGAGSNDVGPQALSRAIRETGVNYVKLNAMVQYKEKVLQRQKPDPTRAPPNYQKGVLPKYLRDKKKEPEKANVEENVRENIPPAESVKDPDCPPGHVLMSDADRREHLAVIRQNYAELINELNNLPFRTDSLKARQRKMELEKELDKMEAAIKLFSKEKLYVKISK